MNINDLVDMEFFPKQIEAVKTALKIAMKANMAEVAASITGCEELYEDAAEISDAAMQLFELSK